MRKMELGDMVELDKIYCEDCLQTMSRMSDGFVDLTVTSPPYDNLRKYNGYCFDFENVAKELYRVTKAGGVVVWVVGDATVNGSETGTSFKQALFFKEIGFNLHDTMIYEKTSVAAYDPRNKRCKQAFEYMFVLSKGTPNVYNEIKDNPVKKKVAFHDAPHGRNADSKRASGREPYKVEDYQARTNIWQYNVGFNCTTKDKDAFKHPAIFPEKLAADHILSWSNEGDTVYDCFLGSGTTAKMAAILKRHYIGSEISQEYFDIAQGRIGEVLRNPTLF